MRIPSHFYTETILSACETKLETIPFAIGARVRFLTFSCVDPRIHFVDEGTISNTPTTGNLIPPYSRENRRLAEDIGTRLLVTENANALMPMGHSDCKAIEYLLNFLRHNKKPPAPILSRFNAMFQQDDYFAELRAAVSESKNNHLDNWRSLTDWATLTSARNLLGYRVGAHGETLGEVLDQDATLNLIPSFNNLATGEIEFYDPATQGFVPRKNLTNTWVENIHGDNTSRSVRMEEALSRGQERIAKQIRSGDYHEGGSDSVADLGR